MFKKIYSLIIITLLLINICSCSQSIEKYEAEYVDFFDTYTKIIIYAENENTFVEYSNRFHTTMKRYNKLFDIYNDYEGINNIKTINDNAGIMPIKVDSDIIDLLNFAKTAYKETDGKINVALGSVLKIWHKYRDEGIQNPENAKLPSSIELKNANIHTDINSIIINSDKNTVYISDKNVSIDVGGLAKGYAVQKAAEDLKKVGVKSALLNVGGNVCAIDNPYEAGKTGWGIGIQNPDIDPETQVASISDSVVISDESVVSSGNYQRYYTINNKKYHHIIDPETLMPAEYFKSVSVIHSDSKIADMLSTALFIMPYETGKALAEKYNAQVIWITQDNEILKN